MKERWKPEYGETFWYVSEVLEAEGTTWEDNAIDLEFYKSGNCFYTVEEAQAAAEKIKALLLSLHYNETSTANSETLPDWCKVGKWAAHDVEGQWFYFQIKSIANPRLYDNNGRFCLVSEAVPARLRPYNADEMKALVGKIVKFGKNGEFVALVIMCDSRDGAVYVGDGDWVSESALLKEYTIDGKPCGVLEHLENGEWVK